MQALLRREPDGVPGVQVHRATKAGEPMTSTWGRGVLKQAKTWWLESRYRRPISIRLQAPIVSVTFDDVPMSAYRNALPILRQHGVKATFYVATGMGKGFLGSEQIADIHNQGHEIACHTYSHYRLSTGDCDGLGADARKKTSPSWRNC
jgi:peptidoglycan/xylan/chitin deacetylase (PgdA/CDA1 family)